MGVHILATFAVLLVVFSGCYAIPANSEHALLARYIIHDADWISIASISTSDSIKGYPFVNVKSMSDGPVANGTGHPYFLMTDLDFTGKDVLVDSRVTILATLADTYCKENDFDAQDPRCPRLIISGKFVKVPENTDEHSFAEYALHSRHPVMTEWEAIHGFYVAKLDIEQIAILAGFGGANYVTLEDYFNANEE